MSPTICPLCRKAYLPERSKKLITGEIEAGEADDTAPIGLLKRLVESLGTDSQNDVISEVGQWLHAGNVHPPLKKAHYILREYLVLKAEAQGYQRNIRRLEYEIINLRTDQEHDKENASVIERDLQSQVQQLRS
ncbi:hypothetical protein H0H92_013206 [Tricholoma furcatifolium]|nr:hypothetical protein H0H92_013206 [Tricholoma furcatifolium]